MKRNLYTIYGIGIMLAMHESIIGKRMVVNNNAYIVAKADKEAEGSLYGCIVEITSEPFEEVVHDFRGSTTHTFVYARSLESGIEYRVLWDKSWIVENDNTIPKNNVIGRKIVLSDGSYSKEVGGKNHIYGCEKAEMVIISTPFVMDCTEKGDVRTYKYLFVYAYRISDGRIYRVLFNESDLVAGEPKEIIINVLTETSVELS